MESNDTNKTPHRIRQSPDELMAAEVWIFDLDNTLLDGDSDYLWGQFLVEEGRVDGESYERQNREFYQQYQAGTLDIDAFASFSLAPLAEKERD